MYMRKQSLTLAAAAVATFLGLGLSASAIAQGASGSGMGLAGSSTTKTKAGGAPMADQRFVMNAAKGGMAEVALGQLAQQKAASDSVKTFGSHMVDDHSKANDELKQIATAKGITLPDAAPNDSTSRKLQSLSGAPFDKAYMTAMLADHKKTIALFEKEASNGKDADLKAFATKTLPTLKSHLQMVQQTQASVGG